MTYSPLGSTFVRIPRQPPCTLLPHGRRVVIIILVHVMHTTYNIIIIPVATKFCLNYRARVKHWRWILMYEATNPITSSGSIASLSCLYVSPALMVCHFLLVKVSCTRPVAVFMFPLPKALRIIKIQWHYAKKLSPLLLATTNAKRLLCGICQSNFHHLEEEVDILEWWSPTLFVHLLHLIMYP